MNSREKGKRGEREWASVCREHGWDVRRTAQYCGNTGDASDCAGLPGIHQEVKRVERLDLYAAMAQATRDAAKSGNVPIVAHRKNNCPWLVTMHDMDWTKLYSDSDAAGKVSVEKRRAKRLLIYNTMAKAQSRNGMPIVKHSRDGADWYITMIASDWFTLYNNSDWPDKQYCDRQDGGTC